MPLTSSAGFKTALAKQEVDYLWMLLLQRYDGVTKGIVDIDMGLDYDRGDGLGVIHYTPLSPILRGLVEKVSTLEAEPFTIEGVFDGTVFDAEDVRRGIWDDCEYRVFRIFPGSPDGDRGLGREEHTRGFFTGLGTAGAKLTIKAENLISRFKRPAVHVLTTNCPKDLGVTDDNRAVKHCPVKTDPPFRQDSTAYTVRPARDPHVGSTVKPATYNGFYYKCIAITGGGLSGVGEPTWPTTLGGTVVDNEVTWEAVRALDIPFTVATLVDAWTFTITTSPVTDAPDHLLTGGLCTWGSGPSLGLRPKEARAWTLSSKTVQLYQRPYDAIAVGHTGTLRAGCRKTLDACTNDFDAVHWHGGVDDPSVLETLTTTANVAR
jgi:hypothetical protein